MTLDKITLIYTSESGETYEQPLSDIPNAGTLIDPDTGEDLELTGWRFTTTEGN